MIKKGKIFISIVGLCVMITLCSCVKETPKDSIPIETPGIDTMESGTALPEPSTEPESDILESEPTITQDMDREHPADNTQQSGQISQQQDAKEQQSQPDPKNRQQPTPVPEVKKQDSKTEAPAQTEKPVQNEEKPKEDKPKLIDRSDLRGAALSEIDSMRAESGNPAASLNGDLNSKAAAHAKKMAEQKKVFHSSYGLTESVLADVTDLVTGKMLAGRAVVHNGVFKEDKRIQNVGIGIYENTENGKIYFCLLGYKE